MRVYKYYISIEVRSAEISLVPEEAQRGAGGYEPQLDSLAEQRYYAWLYIIEQALIVGGCPQARRVGI